MDPVMKHRHPDAYCLLRYRADNRHAEEVVWNSRDGLATTTIFLRDGTPATRFGQADCHVYAPDHVPVLGDLVLIDLTERRALEIAAERAESLWAAGESSGAFRDTFASAAEFLSVVEMALLADWERGQPELVEVTEELARQHGWPTAA